ncbi:sulfotransferase domain-containing protein [Celeribacter sp.]|uniref:sulfotransferase domain-containing protein n=1 Tax=Celeribacter sp. TaxID=1890673 RepID=UPI003A8D68A7
MLLICCGMPRSGSTLQFNIAWKTARAARTGDRVAWRSSDDWAHSDAELARLEAAPELHVIKMHFPPDNLRRLAETGGRVRFLYVHRDLLDVVYSMKTKFDFSISRALDRVGQALDAEDWLLSRPSEHVLVQDYTLLLNDLPEAVRQIATFSDAPLSETTVEEISRSLSIDSAYEKSRRKTPKFEHLRRKINRAMGRKIAFADDELMLHPNHVSEHRGQVGIGRAKLSPAEITTIENAFGTRISGPRHVG